MRAAVLEAYHRPLVLVERPDPDLVRPDQVLLRVAGAGVCATDLHAMDGLMEPAGVTLPRVLGHENTGVVEEVGSLVSTVAVGDAVMVYPPYSCGLCLACPARVRHALRAPRVHGPDDRRRVRRAARGGRAAAHPAARR